MATCMVHPDSSQYDYAEITIKDFIRYLSIKYNFLIAFGIPMKLVRLIKMCLT